MTATAIASANGNMVFNPEYSHSTFDVPEREFRCPHCHRLLWKGCVGAGSKLEMKCPRCKNEVKIGAV